MSQALYRQYRPQRFDDVVGQAVAVRTLRNAIEQDRVAHAYLFTGTKGTGKTTLAKLLAKALNCINGPTIDPCGVCEECVSIAEGRSMNVLEIDAASNRGIDVVREKIIDTVAFQPSSGTKRVYILDEAHQFTPEAFNALLKTVEEPPAHIVFVFCTTETHLMKATVRDRCQRITMRSPGPDTLYDVLLRVCGDEKLQVEEAALRAVARAGQGSFRNALGILEMLTTTFGTSFSRDDVLQHLGVVAEETLFEMADAVIDADAATVLRIVERLVQDGVDLDQFGRSLAEHLRSVLLQLHGLDEHATVGDPERLAIQAGRAEEPRVLAAIDCIADATTRMRVGSDPRISIETALVRACHGLGLPLLALRLAALEQGATGSYGAPLAGATTPPRAAQPTQPAAKAASVAAASVAAPTPTPAAAAAPAAAPPAAPRPEPLDEAQLGDVGAWWPKVAQLVARNAAHRPMLQQLEPETVAGDKLVLRPAGSVHVTPKLRDALANAAFEVTGRRLTVELLELAPAPAAPAKVGTAGPAPSAPAPAAPKASAPAKAARQPAPSNDSATPAPPALQDEGVMNLMSMFDATHVLPGDEE